MIRRVGCRPLPPAQKNGNLYYIRLKTPLGIFYKLGFTSLPSVEARLAFQGTGDDEYIDEVLYFAYHDNAFAIESTLHSHFSGSRAFREYSAEKDMPLCGNGQTELYYEDVLRLDQYYTEEQSDTTRFNVQLAIIMRRYPIEAQARKRKIRQDIENKLLMGLLYVVGNGVSFVAFMINRIFGTKALQEPAEPKNSPDVDKALAIFKAFEEDRRRDLHRRVKELLEQENLIPISRAQSRAAEIARSKP